MHSHMTAYMHSHTKAYIHTRWLTFTHDGLHSHTHDGLHSHTQILMLTMIGNRIAASVVMTAINTTTPRSCTPVYMWILLFGMCLT